jgi:hypothetical protein
MSFWIFWSTLDFLTNFSNKFDPTPATSLKLSLDNPPSPSIFLDVIMYICFIFAVLDQTSIVTGHTGSTFNATSASNPAEASFNGMIEDQWPTVTGWIPYAWISITLPEVLLIPVVKVYTFEVINWFHCKVTEVTAK